MIEINNKRLNANMLLLLTAAIWGFSFVAQRVGSQYIGSFTFNSIRFFLGSISLIPLIPILYGGFLSVGIAYTLQVIGQRNAKPSHACIILNMESVFSAIGGALILGESMSIRGYTGCLFIIGGIIISQVKA